MYGENSTPIKSFKLTESDRCPNVGEEVSLPGAVYEVISIGTVFHSEPIEDEIYVRVKRNRLIK